MIARSIVPLLEVAAVARENNKMSKSQFSREAGHVTECKRCSNI